MYRLAKIGRTLCVVIASSSAFAAPYAFKITCKDPARMRPVGEETEFRIQCTAGLADVCCPPPSVWSAYNSLGSADKKIVPCPGVGHHVPGHLRAQQQRWLAQ